MKELGYLIKTNNFSAIFLLPTDNFFIQFIRYVYVGGIAFVADSGTLFILHDIGLHYLISAGFAFIVGLFVNYLMSKRTVFVTAPKNVGRIGEFVVYGAIGLAGLALTELFMFLFTDRLGLYFMLSKAVTAALVLIWNFIARKMILYR